jgi:hypothetical protein
MITVDQVKRKPTGRWFCSGVNDRRNSAVVITGIAHLATGR